MRNSAPAANNASNISAKSRFIPPPVLECPRLARQRPHHPHAFFRSRAADAIPRLLNLEGCSPGPILRAIALHLSIIGDGSPLGGAGGDEQSCFSFSAFVTPRRRLA